jgi:outer membrane protein assembly factor BamB
MRDSPSISRRQTLAALGVSAVGLGGYLAGVRTADAVPDWLAGRECDPAPFVTDPADWSVPRRDQTNSSHAPAQTGPDWPLDHAWEREWPVPGFFRVAPLTVSNGVVLASASADVHGGLYAFSLADGQVRWQVRVEDNDMPHPAMAAGGLVFFVTETPETLAVQALALADGSVQWQRPARRVLTVAAGRVVVTDPAAVDPRRVVAYDARTGTRCWATTTPGRADSALVDDETLVVPRRDPGVTALDLATGEQRWESRHGGGHAVIDGDRLLVSRFAGELQSLALPDGSQEWAVTSEHYAADERNSRGDPVARPDFELGSVVEDTLVYTLDVFSDYPSRVQARDVTTGEVRWDYGPTPERGPRHAYSRPIAIGDAVVVVEQRDDESPTVVRLDAATGEERDRLALDIEYVVAPPVVAGGHLLVATRERLLAFA